VNFQQFAEQHGLMIDSLILDRWVRVPTVDHPKKRNGAYIWDGREGALINFAVHDKHVLYRSDEPWKPDPQAAAKRRQMEQERLKRQASAANKAAWILNQASLMQHPYLIRKGFEDKGYVWRGSLVLPMRVADRLTTLFMEEVAAAREREVSETYRVIDTQMQEARQRLEEKKRALREFEQKHRGQLPEQVQVNLAIRSVQ